MDNDNQPTDEIKLIMRALAVIRNASGFGSVLLIVKNGQVTLVETTTKLLVQSGELKKYTDVL